MLQLSEFLFYAMNEVQYKTDEFCINSSQITFRKVFQFDLGYRTFSKRGSYFPTSLFSRQV